MAKTRTRAYRRISTSGSESPQHQSQLPSSTRTSQTLGPFDITPLSGKLKVKGKFRGIGKRMQSQGVPTRQGGRQNLGSAQATAQMSQLMGNPLMAQAQRQMLGPMQQQFLGGRGLPIHDQFTQNQSRNNNQSRSTQDQSGYYLPAGTEYPPEGDYEEELNTNNGATSRLEQIWVSHRLCAPDGVSSDDLQAIIDMHFYPSSTGGAAPPARPRRRTYDTNKLSDVFENGSQVWDALNRAARKHFARFFYIFDEDVVTLIDQAANFRGGVDRNSDGFKVAYERVLEWRKNWLSRFAEGVDTLLVALNTQNPELRALKTTDELVKGYSQFFKYETMYSILGASQCIIDLRACMAIEKLNLFYETVFSWALTYAHKAKFSTGDEAIPRAEFLRRLRLISCQPVFKEIKIDDLLLLPDKPVAKLRKPPRKKVRYDDILDDFTVIAKGQTRSISDARSLFITEEAETSSTAETCE